MNQKQRPDNPIRRVMDESLPGLENDPWFEERVLHLAKTPEKKQPYHMPRKLAAAFAVMLIVMLTSVTALAAVLLTGHDVKLYEGVEILNLLPDQQQEYDVCHRLSSGYLVGGFSLGEDYIAPMEENDAIVMLDDHFRLRWMLIDPRLEGCLMDKVSETKDGLYMGMERLNGDFLPAILKLSPEGAIQWLYEGDAAFRMKDFAVDGEGNVYCVGSAEEKEGRSAWVLKLDGDGTPAWQGGYGKMIFTAVKSYHDRVILAGYGEKSVWIGEMNADGQVGWQQTIPLDIAVQTVRLQSSADGRLVLSVQLEGSEDQEATMQLRYYVLDAEMISQ